MEQSTITLSSNTKRWLLSAAVVLLSAVAFLPVGGLITMLALVLQIGLFSAILSLNPKLWQVLLPLASYGVGYLLTNNPIDAAMAVIYAPPAVIVGLFLRKGLSRGAAVVVSSLTVGLTAVGVIVAELIAAGIKLSFSDVSVFVTELIDATSEYLVSGVPNSLFTAEYTKEMYIALIKAGIKQFSFSFAVILCNIIAFSATAVTRRAVKWLETETGDVANTCKNWLFVLSKPSAVVFVVCYLCLLVGGETLTLSQLIAFNTVMVAIQCGLMVMACRSIRASFRVAGFSSVLIYLVVFYLFKLQGVALVLSITGIVAVFKRNSKEDVQ